MIIGISGKKQSGKDAVGKIIQYLIWNKKNNVPDINCIDYINGSDDYYVVGVVGDIDYKISLESNWKIKKFADKLKDIVCLLINCTREQLEDETFKNIELGEEWWYWKLEREGDYSTILLPYYESIGTENFELIKLTPRLLLQLLGTECGRDIIHPNIWVNSLMSEYDKKTIIGSEGNIVIDKEDSWREIPKNWIITDMRFPNEANAIKQRDGIIIRVNSIYGNTDIGRILVGTSGDDHESETALDNYKEFDYVIDNNGTIKELIEKVNEILIKEGLLNESK